MLKFSHTKKPFLKENNFVQKTKTWNFYIQEFNFWHGIFKMNSLSI